MKIAVFGAAGNGGSAAAFNIAVQRLADELVLIDAPRPDMVALHAMDMNTAVTGQDMLVRAGSDDDIRGADIVVVAAGSAQVFKSRLEVLPQNLPIIQAISQKVRQHCPGA